MKLVKMECEILRYGILLVFLLAAGFPLFWLVSTGLKTPAEYRTSVWRPATRPRLGNWKRVWFGETLGKRSPGSADTSASGGASPFKQYYINSVFVTFTSVFLAVGFGALAAYPLARIRFPLSGTVFHVFLLGMMVPVHITLIPLYRLMAPGVLGLRNTYLALICPYVAFSLPVTIFILRGFFSQVPRELEEAARVDGCGELGVFFRIMLPLSKPALATVIIFNFVTIWNEFVFAYTFIDRSEYKTIPVGLMDYSDSYAGDTTMICAALTIAILPLLVVYFFAQKHIIRGLTAGAIKG